jgi:hypothetical protein
MRSPFGREPIGALLRSLATVLPVGSSIEVITPIGDKVKQFLRQFARAKRSGLLGPKVWSLAHTGPQGAVFQFAQLAEEHSITALSVWFTVVGSDGATLLEAEDGNTVLFLSDALAPDAVAAIIRGAGVAGSGVPSAALRRSSGAA